MHFAITGVSRGLGRALVNELALQGHIISGCARSPAAVDELRDTYGEPHSFEVVDVNDWASVSAWADTVIASAGPPQRLVNNAAIINRNAKLWDVPVEEFSQVIDINIKGMFHVIRAFTPAMIQAGDGIIVNLSSGWGRVPGAEVAPYCATKWAVEGMTQSLAMDLPKTVSAVALNPGIINTDMLQSCFGSDAGNFPTAEQWAKRAAPMLIGLSRADNAKPLTVE